MVTLRHKPPVEVPYFDGSQFRQQSSFCVLGAVCPSPYLLSQPMGFQLFNPFIIERNSSISAFCFSFWFFNSLTASIRTAVNLS